MTAGVPLQDVMLFGRWGSESSAREYLRKGEVFLLRARSNIAEALWQRAGLIAALGAAVFDNIGRDLVSALT